MKNEAQAESVLARVSTQLKALEKRDWELWLIVSGTGILVGAAFIALAFPSAILHEGSLHFEIDVSRELFISLVAMLVLLNTYVISRRLELRRTREMVISTTIQSELIRLQSFTDPLTEVYNRRMLDDMFHRYISHAKRLSKPMTLMVVDVDRFKDINTQFGHLTGDFVLAEIASLLRGAVRGSDAVVRYGGDEFLVFLADSAADGAAVVNARVAKSVQDWNSAGHLGNFEMTLSIGMAQWKENGTLDELLTEADQKMYAAKDARKRGAPILSPSPGM
ncbi:MAG: GGDEF domain-containing protein [Deltaproteobacteria bacterium]